MIKEADLPQDEAHDWRPAYVQVAESLRDRILSGEFPAGSALPSEPALSVHYRTSRTSVRTAIRQLRDWGLVQPRQGAGTFVLKRRGSMFGGLLLDGDEDQEQAVTQALVALDPRYIACWAGLAPAALDDLCQKGRVPIVHARSAVGPMMDAESSSGWLNALLWPADATMPNFDSATCVVSLRLETMSVEAAARVIHATVGV